jgi:hypothetical protein
VTQQQSRKTFLCLGSLDPSCAARVVHNTFPMMVVSTSHAKPLICNTKSLAAVNT